MSTRAFVLSIAATLTALAPSSRPAARLAEHAKIELTVVGPRERQTSHMDQTPPAWGKNPRPVVKAAVGDTIQIQYLYTNVYPNKTINDVVIHFYVVRVDAVGAKEPPPSLEGDRLVLESAHDLDMRPGTHTGGRARLRIDRAGVYLVRVESKNTQSDHEHFSAIDLVVEDK